jgi:DNA polymerase I-like protein with 3'-5' exonuclease and polymerase domains
LTATLKVLRTVEEVKALQAYLADKPTIAVDTETTGLVKGSEIIGFSVCAELDVAYYVVLAYWELDPVIGTCGDLRVTKGGVTLETGQPLPGKLVRNPEVKAASKELLESLKRKQLIYHNATFDCGVIEDFFGVALMPYTYVDTLILAHLLDENRAVGLKDLAVSIFGEHSADEQKAMKESVTRNGGLLTKAAYELYKADSELIGKYGAQDTLLTLRLLYELLPQLYEQNLDDFFFTESMPLLRGPTYDLNRTGVRIDQERLQTLKKQLEADCLEAKAYIEAEIKAYVSEKYPGTNKKNTFNIDAGAQLAWLIFEKLGNPIDKLTDGGRDVAKALQLKLPYTLSAKREFVRVMRDNLGRIYEGATLNVKTGKMGRPKKVKEYWNYLTCDEEAISKFSGRYRWVDRLLRYKKDKKLLNTYLSGIETAMQYGVVRASFMQHGTVTGRYSCASPNLQNLPRDDKRVKSCFIARPGKVFVGADFSQLEARVFASFSKDEALLKCFKDGLDFYSVMGARVFKKIDCHLKKNGSPDSFPVKYKALREASKVFSLAIPYGTLAPQMSGEMQKKAKQVKSIAECQEIIDQYFETYPSVEVLMLTSHEQVKTHGVCYNLFGRHRRVPDAKLVPTRYGKNTPHSELPREARGLLNQGMNFPIQSTGASIMNRACIRGWENIQTLAATDSRWEEVKLVLQIHDEVVLEGPEELAEDMVALLQDAMQNTTVLPGVDLIADPKIAKVISDLK